MEIGLLRSWTSVLGGATFTVVALFHLVRIIGEDITQIDRILRVPVDYCARFDVPLCRQSEQNLIPPLL
jgi:hypothetical protein